MVNYIPNFNFGAAIKKQTVPITTPCMDQICGWVDIDGSYNSIRKWKTKFDIDYITNGRAVSHGRTIKSPIVIILESPHVDEFDSNGKAKGPAQGKTGDFFDIYFEQLLKQSIISNIIGTSTHAVVFVNSVQYQCSLGKRPLKGINRNNCNRNWKLCFQSGCDIDLVDRLNALNPIAVINLCTATLKKDVEQKVCHFSNYTRGNHPISWRYNKNRKIQ